ncbi:hypothetical protein M9H77_03978 [Catharanthus roseus]|uniref:Uncharacterized protein n=1 Tax=Catharanthus roseus TaxID=4058 RepID=A0ACC0CCY8_CATRO|nr:hypothetical protein M9H77_03978 [Catharanthus roseus]
MNSIGDKDDNNEDEEEVEQEPNDEEEEEKEEFQSESDSETSVPISTPSSSAAEMSLRPTPSLSARSLAPPVKGSASNRLVQSRLLKSSRSTLFRHMQDVQEKQASLCYKDLMYEIRADGYQPKWMTTAQYTSLYDVWSLDPFKKKREVAQRNRLQGHGGQGPGGSRTLIEWVMSMVFAHKLQPSPPNDREAAADHHRFCRYLLWLPTMPVLRGRRGCRDTCSMHRASSPAS